MQLEGVDVQGQPGSEVMGVAAVLGCIQYEDFCSTEHVRNEPTPSDRYMPQLRTNKKSLCSSAQQKCPIRSQGKMMESCLGGENGGNSAQ